MSFIGIERSKHLLALVDRTIHQSGELLWWNHRERRGEAIGRKGRYRHVVFLNLPSLQLKAIERLELGLQGRILTDAFGMQLQIDPLIDAQPPYLFHVGGTCTKCEPIQYVDDLFIDCEFLVETAGCTRNKRVNRCYDEGGGQDESQAFHKRPSSQNSIPIDILTLCERNSFNGSYELTQNSH